MRATLLLVALLATSALCSPDGRLEPSTGANVADKASSSPVPESRVPEAGKKSDVPAGPQPAPLQQMANLKVNTRAAAVAAYEPAEAWLKSNNQKELRKLYAQWKKANKISYGPAEDVRRFRIFRRNLATIISENKKEENTHWLGLTGFAAMTPREFAAAYLTRPNVQAPTANTTEQPPPSATLKALPTYVDWAYNAWYYGSSAWSQGYVTRPRPYPGQGKCGSCYAFAGVAAAESRWLMQKGKTYGQLSSLDLSEQMIVDCCNSVNGYPNSQGCSGGLEWDALSFMAKYFIVTESQYPYSYATQYQGRTGSCNAGYLNGLPRSRLSGSGYYKYSWLSASTMMQLVYNQPLVVGINVSDKISLYKGGYLATSSMCKSGDGQNHAVLATGWSSSGSSPYWILKNSWGETWGSNGYLLMPMTSSYPGFCNMYYTATYPTSYSQMA